MVSRNPREVVAGGWDARLRLRKATSALPGRRSNYPIARRLISFIIFHPGSVLSRGLILKSDHLPSQPDLSHTPSATSTSTSTSDQPAPPTQAHLLHLRGASNFRPASLGVYGVAQPTETGLRTILNVLRSQPRVDAKGNRTRGERETVWFSSREEACVYIGAQPFVSRSRVGRRVRRC